MAHLGPECPTRIPQNQCLCLKPQGQVCLGCRPQSRQKICHSPQPNPTGGKQLVLALAAPPSQGFSRLKASQGSPQFSSAAPAQQVPTVLLWANTKHSKSTGKPAGKTNSAAHHTRMVRTVKPIKPVKQVKRVKRLTRLNLGRKTELTGGKWEVESGK